MTKNPRSLMNPENFTEAAANMGQIMDWMREQHPTLYSNSLDWPMKGILFFLEGHKAVEELSKSKLRRALLAGMTPIQKEVLGLKDAK